MPDSNDDQPEPELDATERDALAAWQPGDPPAGFADRVTAAPPALGPMSRPARARRWGPIIGVFAGLAVAAIGSGIALKMSADDERAAAPSAGAVTADGRQSLAIGHRAVAVAEPGAVIAWTVDAAGKTRVEHGAGNVFYRVDHGGPFVVATPLGEVTVTGTCFRVEVIMTGSKKQTLVGGAIGAALAAAVVVTVYEGGVVVAGGKGLTNVGAGERATLTADGTPTTGPAVPVADIAPPAAGATRDQLLARDELQRQRIAGLTSRVGELERQLSSAGGREPKQDTAGARPWYDPGPEQLAEFAKNCEVRFDLPPVDDSAPERLSAEDAAEYGITDAEIEPINAVLAEMHDSWAERMRAIYLDVVGEAGAVEGLSAQSMMTEIEDKSPPSERQAIKARIAQERAGLATPPADWSHASPIERLFRSLAALGDEMEHALGARIGADRAHAFRVKGGGWPSKRSMSGCVR